MKISLLIPTRGRPNRILQLINSSIMLASGDNRRNIEILLRVDEDDRAMIDFEHVHAQTVVGPRPNFLSDAYNELAARSTGDILVIGSDDITFVRNYWDQELVQLFQHNLVVNLEPDTFIHFALSRTHLQALGFLFPRFEHGYIDYWVRDLYNKVGGVAFTRLVVHHHWHANAVLFDGTYSFRNQVMDERDLVRYQQELIKLDEYVAKLKEYKNG